MKTLILTLGLLFASISNAQDVPNEVFMSVEDQTAYMEELSKDMRRDLWKNGYEEVSSVTEFMTKTLLDDYVSGFNEPGFYTESLNKNEVSSLYRCMYSKSCELYLVVTFSQYQGGEGEVSNFILLYTKSKKHFKISHTSYAE